MSISRRTMSSRSILGRGCVVAALLLAGCTSVVRGHGVASASTIRFARAEAALDGARVAVPAGATRDENTAWDRTTRPTAAQYAAWDYSPADRSSIVDELSDEGLVLIENQAWHNADNEYDNDVLFAFGTTDGARERYVDLSSAEAGGTDFVPSTFSIRAPSGGEATSYTSVAADSYGYRRVVIFAQRGPVLLENWIGLHGTFDTALVTAWSRAQLAALG